MCAVFGFGGFDDEALLTAMGEVLAARGPDGAGEFREDRMAIGNRRLAILDLPGGVQPLHSDDGKLVISHSGELYNYLELRTELEALGHRFRTETDTEVVLQAYGEWGDSALERFNGMFAFAIYNRAEKQLLLARDPSGQKPMYYWEGGGRLVFASEIKAILRCPFVDRRPNLEAIDPFLALRYVPEPATMFEGIQTLPAGHVLKWSRGETRLRRYWEIPVLDEADKPRCSEGEWIERLDATLDAAIGRHLRADVPCGAYLSSGVDSAMMVERMTRLSGSPVQTFAIGFGSSIDETGGAAETARLLGAEHHEVQLEGGDFAGLDRVIEQMDRPVGDALILAFDKLAAAAGEQRRVMLAGEGADELFAGYPFHKVLKLAESYRRRVPSFLARGLVEPGLWATPHPLLNRLFQFPADLGRRGKAKLLDFLGGYRKRSLPANAAALRTLWGGGERSGLYTEEFAQRRGEDWLPEAPAEGCFIDRMLAMQWDEWLQDWALIRQEKNNLAHAVECRAPFLDRELVELAFQMPASLKLRGLRDKWVLRRLAERRLPREVARRAKIPFYLPLGEFLRSPEMRRWIELTLNRDQVARRGYFRPEVVAALRERVERDPEEFVSAKQLVSLVILELWHMVFIDADPVG